MTSVKKLFLPLIVLIFMAPVRAADAKCDGKIGKYIEMQKHFDLADSNNIEQAKMLRAKLIEDLRSSSIENLKRLYQELPKGAYTLRYACILLAAHVHQTNIDPHLNAMEGLNSLIASLSMPLEGPVKNYYYLSIHSIFFDEEHFHHVIPLVEHVINTKITTLNILKSNTTTLPITLLQLSDLRFICCANDVHHPFENPSNAAMGPNFDIAYFKISPESKY